jgi:raffinose/stachyose/melibiose transport system substrate-binding protein
MLKLRGNCVLLAALVVSLVLASSVAGNPKAKSSASTTLSLLAATQLSKGIDNMIAGFEKANPDIDVRANYVQSQAAAGVLLTTQISSGNPPDLAVLSPGNSSLNAVGTLGRANRLADLSKESWVRGLPKRVKELGSSQGKVYGFPFTNFFFGMTYSAKVFRDTGVKVPTTTAQLIASCKKIAAKGITPVALAPTEANLSFTHVWTIAAQYVFAKQPKWADLRAKHKVRFATTKGWKDTFGWFTRLKAAGCLSPGVGGTAGAQATRDLSTGKAAMYSQVNVTLGQQRTQAPDADIGFFIIPAEKAKDTKVAFSSTMMGITSKNNVAAAKKFVAFMAAPANNAGYNKISGAMSNTAVAKGKLPVGNGATKKPLKNGLVAPAYTSFPNPNFLNYTGKALQSLLTGQKSTDEILKGMDYLFDNPTAVNPPGG